MDISCVSFPRCGLKASFSTGVLAPRLVVSVPNWHTPSSLVSTSNGTTYSILTDTLENRVPYEHFLERVRRNVSASSENGEATRLAWASELRGLAMNSAENLIVFLGSSVYPSARVPDTGDLVTQYMHPCLPEFGLAVGLCIFYC